MMVPDNKMALVQELVKVVTDMEIVEIKDVEGIEEFQRKSPMERFDFALTAIVEEKGVIANRYDLAWLYAAVQEGSVKGIKFFSSVDSFRKHLEQIGIQHVPSNSSISAKVIFQKKPYPNWNFTDCDLTEAQRRINIVKRFLCLYHKGK